MLPPIVTEVVAPTVRFIGWVFALLGFIALLLTVIVHLVVADIRIPADIARLRIEGISWMGKGLLMVILACMVDGSFKWRKDD